MPDKKIIFFVGATGAQGGSLVRAILDDPSAGFVPRAITRDLNSPSAKELASLGALVVRAVVPVQFSERLPSRRQRQTRVDDP